MCGLHCYFSSKLDAVDRFWTSIEPYCADITSNDMTLLYENNMTVSRGGAHTMYLSFYCLQHEEEQEYYKIPPLGKHYSYKWAMAEMQKEQQGNWLPEASDKKSKDQLGDGMYYLVIKYLQQLNFIRCCAFH